MKKILYIIPGFGEKVTEEPYMIIKEHAEYFGYTVISIPIVWDRKTIKDWVYQFEKIVDGNETSHSTVLGFSFGALIALISTKKFSFKKLLVCSASPYLKENIPHLPLQAHKMLGKKRMGAFLQYNLSDINKNTPAVFIVGGADISLVIQNSKDLFSSWVGPKKIIILPGVKHEIENSDYIQAIKNNLT